MRFSQDVLDTLIKTMPLAEVLKLVIAADELPDDLDIPTLSAGDDTARPEPAAAA